MAELFLRHAGEAGITHASVGRWRRGESEPTPDNIEELCRILNVNAREVYALLGRIEPYDQAALSPQQIAVIEGVLSGLTADEVAVLAANVEHFMRNRKSPRQAEGSFQVAAG
jgi:transcriptional regulator with XRE-family HTH domain